MFKIVISLFRVQVEGSFFCIFPVTVQIGVDIGHSVIGLIQFPVEEIRRADGKIQGIGQYRKVHFLCVNTDGEIHIIFQQFTKHQSFTGIIKPFAVTDRQPS